jgi:hypothetical protein
MSQVSTRHPVPKDVAATPVSTAADGHERAERHQDGKLHWQSWALRTLLLALTAWQLITGNRDGATVAGMGLAVTMIPVLITRFSGWPVPRNLELTFVFAMFLQYTSESLKLFELLTYWDKIVHPAEILLATGVATFLLLGYRECHELDIPDGLAAFGAMLFGMALGASWELVEFAFDWFGNANLQKSNADTMTDILTNDAGAIFGALFAFWLFRHHTSPRAREQCGEIAEWLTGRLSNLLQRHGFLVGVLVALTFAAIIFAGWYVDRGPIPAPPAGVGHAADWRFAAMDSPPSDAQILLGEWQPTQQGLCREDREPPRPGSEKMGLVALEPGQSFGADGAFRLGGRYFLKRPPLGAGTAMDAGLVFGLRDPDNFYVLTVSAIHDTVALHRYLHGRERWVREEHYLTRGDEAHDLSVDVRGDRVAAAIDGKTLFDESGIVDTDGGIGLWARVTTLGCFGEVRVTPL